ncbi:hypothetical protein Sjap_022183 [Stephania japonica]|uniref:Uncharacterized protein n=1 Tax=Stephania japonica TaxID=461633 RepID=A0AAP0ENV8_9MAGN
MKGISDLLLQSFSAKPFLSNYIDHSLLMCSSSQHKPYIDHPHNQLSVLNFRSAEPFALKSAAELAIKLAISCGAAIGGDHRARIEALSDRRSLLRRRICFAPLALSLLRLGLSSTLPSALLRFAPVSSFSGHRRLLRPPIFSVLCAALLLNECGMDRAIWSKQEVSGTITDEAITCGTEPNLSTQGKKLVFVTNNSTKSRKQYAKKFRILGVEVSEVAKKKSCKFEGVLVLPCCIYMA